MAVKSRMDSDGPPTQVREDPTSEVELDAGTPIWHIAVSEGQTQGPYTTAEMVGLRETGTIRDDMLVWQEGWPDWKPLGRITEIVEAQPLELTAVERPRAKASAKRPSTLDIPVSMGDDPFANPDAPMPRPKSSPRVSAAEAMTAGQNRDGTVEINMAEFRRLSTASSPSLSPAVWKPPAVREDSGLIDVAKAREEHEQQQSTAEQEPKAPSIRPEAKSAAGLASVPALVPPREGADFRTKILAGTIALGMVLAAIVAVVAITHDGEKPKAPPAPAVTHPAPPAPPPAPPVAEAPLPEGAAAAAAVGAEGEADEEAGSAQTAPRSSSRRAGATNTARTSSTQSTSSRSSGSNSIDDLLGRALEPGAKKKAPKPAPKSTSSSLPDTPSRNDVMSAMSGVKGKVAACKGSGVATVRVVVAGSTGRVTEASASGVSGATQSCVERAVKTAKFPRFQQSSFTVKFPFKLGG